MLIDWFTVAAQWINFLVLVGLLKYFLYDRILETMDNREQQVAKRLADAEARRHEAERLRQDVEREKTLLATEREKRLAQARKEAEAYRSDLTAKVRADVDQLRKRWSAALREQIDTFLLDLRRRTSHEVCEIAKKALADLADTRLEEQIVQRFLREVDSLDDADRQMIVDSMAASNQVALLQTTYPLPDDLQRTLIDRLRELFATDLNLAFETSDDLLCGIALQTDAHTVGWSLRDYLLTLQQELQQAIEEEAGAGAAAEQAPEVMKSPTAGESGLQE